jgi:O-antigen ligase
VTTAPHPLSPSRRRWLTLVLLALAAAALLATGATAARQRYLTRGIPAGLPEPIPLGGARLGVNVYLDDANDAELRATLADIRGAGIRYVKQPFYFREGYDWTLADRLMAAAAEESLAVIPLLDGDPQTAFAPPDPAAFAAWAGAFAARYGDAIDAYIIWDEPNLASHWGGGPVNPNDYAALLSAAAAAIRTTDAGAAIVAAPLAPTTETGPQNLSETLFLRALYEAGAADAFDAVALKPYGFDNGPDDRRVSAATLNFSRAILIRELLLALGDGGTAIWAGNWGWNSLPDGWAGQPSIWGQTSAESQASWTVAALERARREWPWLGLMFLENWTPGAAADDPRWGFSIAGRPAAGALADWLAAQPPDVAAPGFHLARPDDPAQRFSGAWQFSPQFGADIGQDGDRVTFTFWGTGVGLRVRRADFRARLYATIDGQPANALPRDENGAALVLTSPDPSADFLADEWLARDLAPGIHVLELTAARGWDQWALNGFVAAYRPPEAGPTWLPAAFGALGVALAGVAVVAARGAAWGATGARLGRAYRRLSDRAQLLLVGALAAVAGLTGWLTWGPDALGVYRRLGDLGQLAATGGAAALFYVTPSFLVYTLALAALVALLALRPAWGLALIALTMPFYVPPLPKPILGYRFSPVEVFTLATLAAWAIRAGLDAGANYRRAGRWPARARLLRADWAVLVFVLVATASLFVAARRDVALSEWRVVIVEPALFYLLLRAIRPSGREVWVVLDAWVVGGVIVAGYGLWQYTTGQGLITAEGGLLRLRSIYGSPNNVALYLDRLLPLLVAVPLLGQSLPAARRRLYTLAAAPVGLALLLTFSKGALFLGVPAGLLVVFWVWQRRAGRRTWPWVVGAAAGGVAALLVAGRVPPLAARLDLFGATGFFRVNLWRAAVNMAIDHPLLGVGLDNFLYAYRGGYIFDAAWQEPNLNHPHNLILDFATRLGLLGLLAGAWLVGEAARALWRALNRTDTAWLPVAAGLAGGLAAMVAHGLVDHSFFLVDLAFVFYLILGVGVWLGRPR